MRKGFDGLAAKMLRVLAQEPHDGALFFPLTGEAIKRLDHAWFAKGVARGITKLERFAPVLRGARSTRYGPRRSCKKHVIDEEP